MGNRLSKIATRTGDDGTTGLGDGSRVQKDDARIAAIGDVDELNSQIGVLLCEPLPGNVRDALVDDPARLFDLGGELCIPGHSMIETRIWRNSTSGSPITTRRCRRSRSSSCRAGRVRRRSRMSRRTVCRRAERSIVALGRADKVNAAPRQYVNRLSDLLFVLARVLNRVDGGSDVLWDHERRK